MLRRFIASKQSRVSRDRLQSFRLESLEDRRVPAGLVQISFNPGTGVVDIEGSALGDTINITSNQNPNSPLYGLLSVNGIPVVDSNTGTAAFWGEGTADNAETLIVHGNGGNDTIRTTGL